MLVKTSVIEQYFLGLVANRAHRLHSFNGVSTDTCLGTQHHYVGAIEYGIRYVARFCTSGASIVDHRLQHLRCRDHWFGSGVAQSDDTLLHDRHCGGGNLHAEVAPGHHDRVRGVNDSVKVCQRFRFLDLGDKPLRTTMLLDVLSECLNVGGFPDKRKCDVVNVMLNGELDVSPVLRSHRRLRDRRIGKVKPLTRFQQSSMNDHRPHGNTVSIAHLHLDEAIIKQQHVALFHVACNGWIGDRDYRFLGLESSRAGNSGIDDANLCAGNKRNCVDIREVRYADLWTLQVGNDRKVHIKV